MNNPHVYLFTDGSCTGTGTGAWCSLVVAPKKLVRPQCGVSSYTTINRCELQPVIDGLRWISAEYSRGKSGIRVALISDSETVIRIISGVAEPGSNLDLWAAYEQSTFGLKVMPVWRERNSHPYMIYVDTVCSSLRKVSLDRMKYITDIELPNANHSMEGIL